MLLVVELVGVVSIGIVKGSVSSVGGKSLEVVSNGIVTSLVFSL